MRSSMPSFLWDGGLHAHAETTLPTHYLTRPREQPSLPSSDSYIGGGTSRTRAPSPLDSSWGSPPDLRQEDMHIEMGTHSGHPRVLPPHRQMLPPALASLSWTQAASCFLAGNRTSQGCFAWPQTQESWDLGIYL